MTNPIPVFYSEQMVVDAQSRSPSSLKPKKVVNAWGLMEDVQIQLMDVQPVTVDDLCLAHEADFVKGVVNGEIKNGFNNYLPEVAASLFYTNGSLRDAAAHAIKHRCVTASPSAGFHHACWNLAADYCTFNGLMVAACWLLKNKLAQKIGIVDCDFHYGDGTDNIIEKLELYHSIKHFTAGLEYRTASQKDDFFEAVVTAVTDMSDCDIIFYQAGADPYIHDPLGGFLDIDELYLRDKLVFAQCHKQGTPVVWNLAGGYQINNDGTPNWPGILQIHCNTMKACWEVVTS